MKKTTAQHYITGLMALLVFGVFAVCVLSVLLTGADAYRRLTERDQAAYGRRTCVQYVATRVRQADALDAVSVEEFGGADCLVLTETIEGADYVTRVYCWDGWVRELFSAAGTDLDPEDGEQVMEAAALALTLEDGLLRVTATDPAGTQTSLRLCLRSGEGAGS